MAVTGIGSNYENRIYENTYAPKKEETVEKAETKDAASIQEGSTKDDYYAYLQKKYDCMANGNVSISDKHLKACASDSAKAKELEDFLKRIPELEKQGYEQLSARNKAMGGTVTYYQQTWMINSDGSIQSTVYSVTETGMTNAERMKKNMDERLEKQKEKKEEEEKLAEKKEEKETQADNLGGDTRVISISDVQQEIAIRYVEAESEMQAKAMMQEEKPEDTYYPKIDTRI